MVTRLFKILYYLSVPVLIFVLLGFAIESNKSVNSNLIAVNVDHSCGNYFIDSVHVMNEVYRMIDTTGAQPLNQVSLSRIENIINEMIYVRNAEVYKTIDGRIKADVAQRRPLARIINNHGESFYIDANGKLIPLSKDFTARVLVVTGDINIKYSPVTYARSLDNDEQVEEGEKLLNDIFKVASYINGHDFMSAFLDHVYVDSKKGFELIPKNGSHVIEFGSVEDLDNKFYKLMVFYEHGLTKIGWNKYSRINLKYKDQVVCKK